LDEEQQKTPQEINALRIKEDERLAEKMGLALPPPIYTVGTPVIELGKDNFKLSRQNWEAMPTARQAAKAANFGYPGGLSAKSFVSFAWATYGVAIDEQSAEARAPTPVDVDKTDCDF
jgi:hypothetical protein